MNDWFNYLIIKNASIFLQRINFFENSFETNKLKHETGTKRSLKKEREWTTLWMAIVIQVHQSTLYSSFNHY